MCLWAIVNCLKIILLTGLCLLNSFLVLVKKKTYDHYFSYLTYVILARPMFFLKMSLWFSDFRIRTEFFLCYRVKKNVFFHLFGFYNPKTSINRTCSLIFSDYRIRKHPFWREKKFGLYNPNCINTNFKHVCSMNSHFKDNINLPNSHPSVLCHC